MDDDSLLRFGLTAFTTLLVVVDPFGVLPIFLALAKDRPQPERARIVARAVALGFAISLFFLVAGHSALSYLGVTVHAFSISGGILLFATALPMLFGQRPALQSNEDGESGPADIAIFPLAIPLLAGPGTITSILLLTAQARGSIARLAAVALALVLVFLLTHLVLGLASERLVRRIGAGGVHIATRVLGILLAALAVQFVLNGIGDYVRVLMSERD
jgi:multiple antibiotic resistance protein